MYTHMFTRELLLDLGITLDGPSVIKCDSKSAVDMAFDPVAFKNTKHVMRAAPEALPSSCAISFVARGVVTLEHVKGTVMIADLLTKAQAFNKPLIHGGRLELALFGEQHCEILPIVGYDHVPSQWLACRASMV